MVTQMDLWRVLPIALISGIVAHLAYRSGYKRGKNDERLRWRRP